MKYKNQVICDVCKKAIIMPHGRIERNSYGNMHVCHHECSVGRNNPRALISDIELDGVIYSSPEAVFERLCDWKELFPECTTSCDDVIYKIFD